MNRPLITLDGWDLVWISIGACAYWFLKGFIGELIRIARRNR